MLKIIINGFNGKMGRVISQLIDAADDLTIAAGIDLRPPDHGTPFPVFTDINECSEPADVIIDFSTASAADTVVDYAKKSKVPLVMCTTGLSPQTAARITEAANHVAILRSANMSVGVNLIVGLLPPIVEKLANSGFDIEIIEKHHNQKLDAPSGTALMLADALKAAGGGNDYIYDRTKKREKRSKSEIGIHSIRGGTIAGEHTVIFSGRDETIELTHRITSKEVFAVGAVKAAQFLAGKPAGLYTMEDVMQ